MVSDFVHSLVKKLHVMTEEPHEPANDCSGMEEGKKLGMMMKNLHQMLEGSRMIAKEFHKVGEEHRSSSKDRGNKTQYCTQMKE